MAFSPRSIRRNIVKIEASHTGIQEAIRVALPPIVDKMTWRSNETILDHGYNSGKKAFEILAPIAEKTGSKLYVLDNCPHTIDNAIKNYPHANIVHMLGDLSLPPGTLGELKFTKIFSLYGFYFTHDYRSALKSMYEHLLPGGEAFFMIPIKSPIFGLDRLLIQHPEWAVHAEGIFTVPDFVDNENDTGIVKDAIVGTGFEVKQFDVIEVNETFNNIKEVSDFSTCMNPFLLLLPKKSHDELEAFYYKYFLETKTETYTPGVDSPDKPYIWPYTSVHVYAKKPE